MGYSNYRRPVTCSYCYHTGHNKRGCPRYKEHVAEGKVTEHRKLAPRRCSYCADTTHDKRKCEKLHDDKINTILVNRRWIDLVLRDCEDNGIGIGAMLKITDPYSHDKFNLAMVVGFEWDNLFLKYPTKGWIKVKNYMGDIKSSHHYFYEQGLISFRDEHCPALHDQRNLSCALDGGNWRELKLQGTLSENSKIRVVSRVEQDLNKVAPNRILNGGVGVESWFKDRTSADYRNNL